MNKVLKGIYLLEQPTGMKTSHNCLNIYLLVITNELIATEREQQIGKKKMEPMEVKKNLFH